MRSEEAPESLHRSNPVGLLPLDLEVNQAELSQAEQTIGVGTFGEVWLARWHGAKVACKTLRKDLTCEGDEQACTILRKRMKYKSLQRPATQQGRPCFHLKRTASAGGVPERFSG